jgi:hypothetical protein
MSRLTDLAKGKVRFICARRGSLVYETEDSTVRFTIPFDEMGDGQFFPEDKAIYFMKWIKPIIKEMTTGNTGGES